MRWDEIPTFGLHRPTWFMAGRFPATEPLETPSWRSSGCRSASLTMMRWSFVFFRVSLSLPLLIVFVFFFFWKFSSSCSCPGSFFFFFVHSCLWQINQMWFFYKQVLNRNLLLGGLLFGSCIVFMTFVLLNLLLSVILVAFNLELVDHQVTPTDNSPSGKFPNEYYYNQVQDWQWFS